jgi:mono/diheme cytochrome c family protein
MVAGLWAAAALLPVGLTAMGASASAAGSTMSPEARGYAIAKAHCARCHAIERTGPSPLGLAPPFRVLPQRYPVQYLAEALAEGIVTGHPAMPEFTFEPEEIGSLLAYIESLKGSGEVPPGKK